MEEVNPLAAEKFKKFDVRVFCRPYLKKESKCEVVVSNMVETFNIYIMRARSILIDMLVEIRTMLMKRLVTKREEANKWAGSLCPNIQKLLEKEKEETSKCTMMPSTTTLFQVSYYIDTLEVDIEKRSCTCRRWDLKGIPCCHAIAALFYLRNDVESYVDECYTKTTYLRAYSGSIPPLAGERHWPVVDIPLLLPPVKIGPGRPRKNRFKSPHEDPKKPGKLNRHGLQMTCKLCGITGHNKRNCPDKDKLTEHPPPAKRGRGRPRKTCSAQLSQPNQQHDVSAQPSQLGRGNKTIRGGQKSRGGGKGGGRGRGRVGDIGGGESTTKGFTTSSQPSQTMLVGSTQASISNDPNLM